MLEYLSISDYSPNLGSDNVRSADNQQERLEVTSRILRDYTPESNHNWNKR